MLLVLHLFITAIFVLLGILFAHGKGMELIAGYNTASPEEKANYDTQKLCRIMSRFMFVLAGCWLVIAASEVFQAMLLLWIGLALFMTAIIVGIICLNTGSRCRK